MARGPQGWSYRGVSRISAPGETRAMSLRVVLPPRPWMTARHLSQSYRPFAADGEGL